MLSFVLRLRPLCTIRLASQKVAITATAIRRRTYVSNSHEALDSWIAEVRNLERVCEDEISVGKVKDLYSMLPTRSDPPPPGTTSITSSLPTNTVFRPPIPIKHPIPAHDSPLDPVHALIFFYPRTPEALLGPDQTDTLFGPPAPFGRRMWAGGRFSWPDIDNENEGELLRMGRGAVARSRVVSVEKRGFEKGSPMVFVRQQLAYKHTHEREDDGKVTEGPTLYKEERTHVYLPANVRADRRSPRKVEGLPTPDYTYSWVPTPTALFRFSALTWNAHLIHLDRDYAQKVEGYTERLVHGPLTALMLIEALRGAGYGGRINNYAYRARNPVFVGQRQHLNVAFSKLPSDSVTTKTQHTATLWAEDDAGFVGMTATVDLVDF